MMNKNVAIGLFLQEMGATGLGHTGDTGDVLLHWAASTQAFLYFLIL